MSKDAGFGFMISAQEFRMRSPRITCIRWPRICSDSLINELRGADEEVVE